MYFDANRKVTSTIYERLTAEKYNVSILTVQPPNAKDAPDMMLKELSRKKCSRLIQVSTIAGEDKFGKFFGFNIEVLRIEPKSSTPTPGDRSAVVAGEYKKVYRYERNEENYKNLSLSGIGQQAYKELKESLVLENIK